MECHLTRGCPGPSRYERRASSDPLCITRLPLMTSYPSRRSFLWHSGGELGGVALAWLLGRDRLLADAPKARPEFNGGLHHPAKVKRIVQLFMNGGVSQPDTFYYKPELE